MLIEQVVIWEKLRRIVALFAHDPFWQQELLQEALIHLWQSEGRNPGRTTSWYLQSCRFHVQHVLRTGHSVDAPKRAMLRTELPLETDDAWNEFHESTQVDDVVISEVSAREIMGLVSPHLTEMEKNLLNGLIQGFSTRQLAEQLRTSQTCIVKHRHRIATLARRQGVGRSVLN